MNLVNGFQGFSIAGVIFFALLCIGMIWTIAINRYRAKHPKPETKKPPRPKRSKKPKKKRRIINHDRFGTEMSRSILQVHDKETDLNDHTAEKKSRKGIVILIIVIIIALLAAGAYALDKTVLRTDNFLSGTTINGVNVSGMTAIEAQKALTEEWNTHVLIIRENGKDTGKLTGFDFQYNIRNKLRECLYPEGFTALRRAVQPSSRKYSIDMSVSSSTDKFDKQFKKLAVVKAGDGTVQAKNAYVDLSNTQFRIVKEKYGNNLDQEKLKKALLLSIGKGEQTFDYQADKFYEKPKITSDDPSLKKEQEYAEKYLTAKITYEAPNGDITVSPADLNKMISVSDDGKITTDSKAISKFVAKLADQADTAGSTRTLKLAGGKTTVYGGNYGYVIDQKKEAKRLTKDLASGKDVTRKPKYSQKAWGSEQGNDIGDTYVEVDISRQHVWCVENGKTVVSTDVVTGNVNEGNGTPTGTFSLMYKVSPSVLEGSNNDGSSYKTPVNYWMPFWDGCGFHDADWRSAFGGTIYRGNGSHGCVNMPPAQAKKLYSYVEAGMPIIVHN